MKKVFFGLLFVLVVSVVGLGAVVFYYAPEKMRTLIEEKGSEALGKLRVGSVEIIWGWPLGLQLKNVSFEQASAYALIQKVDISVSLLNGQIQHPDIKLTAKIHGLTATYDQVDMPASTPKTAAPLPTGVSEIAAQTPLANLDLELELDGELRLTQRKEHIKKEQLAITNIALKMKLPRLEAPLDFSFLGQVQSFDFFPENKWPVELAAKAKWDNGTIEVPSGFLSFMGLRLNLSGKMSPQAQTHSWQLTGAIADLSKVPLPPGAPVKSWTGSFQAAASAEKKGPDLPWAATGKVVFQGFRPEIHWRQKGTEASGTIALDAATDFRFDGTPVLENLNWKLDGTALNIVYGDLFKKAVGIPLLFDGAGAYKKNLSLRYMHFKLASLALAAAGEIAPEGSSDITVQLSPTSLQGLENYFPPLAKYPLAGQAELTAKIKGALQKPLTLGITFAPLVLRNVRGAYAWNAADQSASFNGPFAIDLNVRGRIENLLPQALSASGKVDLSAMEIAYREYLKKPKGQLLRLDLTAQQIATGTRLQNSKIQSAIGDITLAGNFPTALSQPIDAQIGVAGIDFAKVANWVPMVRSYVRAGTASARIHMAGKLNAADFMNSPLSVTGEMNLNLPSYEIKTSAPVAQSKAPVYQPKPFLDDSQIVRNAKVKISANIGQLQMPDLLVKGIQTKSEINTGILKSSVQVTDIFSGSVALTELVVPLTAKEPVIRASARVNGIEIAQALAWAMPQWKDLASGRSNGEIKLRTVMPEHPEFVRRLGAVGKVEIPSGKMQTLPFVKMSQDLLKKIPMAEKKISDPGPVEARITSDFSMENAQLKLTKLNLLTVQKDQMQADGVVGIDKSIDLGGTLALANPPVRGIFLEANSDSLGRLVIPFHIVGNLLEPKMSFAEKTIETMLGKTADREKTKLIDQTKQKAVEQLKEGAKAKLKGLFSR